MGCSASYVSDNDIHVSLHGVRRRQLLRYDGTNGTYLPDKYKVIFRKDGWDARGLFPVKTPNGTLVASGNLTYGYIEMPLETSGYIGFVNSTGYFKLSPGKFLVLDKLKMGRLWLSYLHQKKPRRNGVSAQRNLKMREPQFVKRCGIRKMRKTRLFMANSDRLISQKRHIQRPSPSSDAAV